MAEQERGVCFSTARMSLLFVSNDYTSLELLFLSPIHDFISIILRFVTIHTSFTGPAVSFLSHDHSHSHVLCLPLAPALHSILISTWRSGIILPLPHLRIGIMLQRVRRITVQILQLRRATILVFGCLALLVGVRGRRSLLLSFGLFARFRGLATLLGGHCCGSLCRSLDGWMLEVVLVKRESIELSRCWLGE